MKIYKYILIFFLLNYLSFAQSDVSLQFEDTLRNIGFDSKLNVKQVIELQKEIQKKDLLNNDINYWTLAGLGGVTAGVWYGVHQYYANAWWEEQDNKFRVINDWEYALSIDKLGHFYGATLIGHLFSAGFEAANFPMEASTIYGALASLAFQLYVEIQDGFGPQWGFSPGDAAADILGSAYLVGQYYIPYLKHFQPRFSYLPSEEFKSGEKPDMNIVNDYQGQKLWLGLRMKELLPEALAEYWPSFLMLSLGYGVKDLDGIGGGISEWYIALDFDAETLPLQGKFWQFIKNTLNYFHFPMPGIRISPDFKFFVFTF
ncbi:MAG: DUF2279 domain-containing protein [Ignavibacteriales bacterium]|nr:DUF2279 domain-containing protein [Ignavibacteriales bacterium]